MKRKAPQPFEPSPAKHPLFLDRIEDRIEDVDVTEKEKRQVSGIFLFMLQASQEPKPEPVLLDRGGDLMWDWLSIQLTPNAYGKLVYLLRRAFLGLEFVCYDAIPHEDGSMTMTIRKKSLFQRKFTHALMRTIFNAFDESKLHEWLHLSGNCSAFRFEAQTRASVWVGDKLGMRTPCRCLRFRGKDEANRDILEFVIEIAMAKKSNELSRLAQSYIKRGTLCVMTIDIRRGDKVDFVYAYSVYRRGEKKRVLAGLPQYEVVVSVSNVVIPMKKGLNGSFMFTARDFFPAEFVEEHKTGADEATLTIDHADLVARMLPEDYERYESMIEHLEELLHNPGVKVKRLEGVENSSQNLANERGMCVFLLAYRAKLTC
ncbi:MAG: hypothetical protein Q9184_000659 [Pyrenodesmia sp. 2 TL-2023]